MKTGRREFLAGVGVMLGSALACRWGTPTPMATCYTAIPESSPGAGPTPTPTPTCYTATPGPTPPLTSTPTPMATCYTAVPSPTPSAEWDRLRRVWYDLDRLAQDTTEDYEKAEQERDGMQAEHRAALDALVQSGELDAGVADDMQTAFDAAAYHVWRLNAPMTCYLPAPGPDYYVFSSSDLARRAEVLEEMAGKSAIDPDTVAEIRTAIQTDISFLSLPSETRRELENQVVEDFGEDNRDFPALGDVGIEIDPRSAEAARLLVGLLLGNPDQLP